MWAVTRDAAGQFITLRAQDTGAEVSVGGGVEERTRQVKTEAAIRPRALGKEL